MKLHEALAECSFIISSAINACARGVFKTFQHEVENEGFNKIAEKQVISK